MFNSRSWCCLIVVFSTGVMISSSLPLARADEPSSQERRQYRARLGPENSKIRRTGDRVYLWAGPPGTSPSSPQAEWFDFTDSVIPAADLQFGIGKDRIRAIDDPLFVSPDDPRLRQLPHSPYRRDERPRTNDEIPVIGVVRGDDVRAYPVALLDRHELVNDLIGGKPVAVGW